MQNLYNTCEFSKNQVILFGIKILSKINLLSRCGNHVYQLSRQNLWCRGVVVITTAQLHSTKTGLGFCAGSNPGRGVFEIHDGWDLWQWSWLEIMLNAFLRSTIPQKQFIIIIIMGRLILSYFKKVFPKCDKAKSKKTK